MSKPDPIYDFADHDPAPKLRCPHCREENAQFYGAEDLPWEEGETADLNCHHCGKPFQIKAVVSIEHWAAKPDDWVDEEPT